MPSEKPDSVDFLKKIYTELFSANGSHAVKQYKQVSCPSCTQSGICFQGFNWISPAHKRTCLNDHMQCDCEKFLIMIFTLEEKTSNEQCLVVFLLKMETWQWEMYNWYIYFHIRYEPWSYRPGLETGTAIFIVDMALYIWSKYLENLWWLMSNQSSQIGQ